MQMTMLGYSESVQRYPNCPPSQRLSSASTCSTRLSISSKTMGQWLPPKSFLFTFVLTILLLPTISIGDAFFIRRGARNTSQTSATVDMLSEPSETHQDVPASGPAVVLQTSAAATVSGLVQPHTIDQNSLDMNSEVLIAKPEDHRKTYINLEQYMRNLTRQPGARAMFYCDILGQPIPQFQWFKDGQLLNEQPNRIRIETGLWGSSLRVEKIDQSDGGMYVCVARNPSGTVNATAYLWVTDKSKTNTNSITRVDDEAMFNPSPPEMDGFCQEFHSNVCGKYLFGHRVFVTREFQQALIESQISKFLKLTATQPLRRIREDCLRNMMEAMCYYNFPVCLPVAPTSANVESRTVDNEVVFRAHYLCRQDCYMIKQNECSTTYKYLERTMLQELPSMIMNCARLPLYSAEHPTACRRIGQPLPVLVQGNPDDATGEAGYWEKLMDDTPGQTVAAAGPEVPHSIEGLRNKAGVRNQVDVTGSLTTGPDLVPLFVSVGVMFIVGFMLLAFCFLCRRNWDRTPRIQADGSSLLSRARGPGSGFGRLNGGGSCGGRTGGTGGTVAARGQGVGASNDTASSKKRRVPGMGSGIKGSKNGRLLNTVDDGYMVAFTPGSNHVFSHSDSSNNLNGTTISNNHNGPHSLPSGPNSQTADLTAHHLKTGSMPTYHQYQATNYGSSSAATGPLPLPPPNAPAPPPPNPLSMGGTGLLGSGGGLTQIPHTSVGTSQESCLGNPNVHLINHTSNGLVPLNHEFHFDMGVPYEANVLVADSPTAYTTLRNSSPNGFIVNGSQVPVSGTSTIPYALNEDTPLRAKEYPISQLRFGKQFGQGVFGPVYKAELLPGNTYENGHPVSVIVKTLSAGSPASLQADFRLEADLIAELDHPNLLSLLGVSLQHPPWCMIFEVRQYVDLCELLASRRAANSSDPNNNSPPLTDTEKLHVVAQVAAGMDYLSSHRFVHRDLAARNVLILNDQLFCKITDLGLARDCYANDYYRLHPHSLMLPIRWMPLDSIIYGKFTVESDIWAYGVLLWEVWSGGMRPYASYSDVDVLDMIRSRQLLPKPTNCSSNVYAFMYSCWHDEPEHRPTFKDCLHQISQWQCDQAFTGGRTNCGSVTYSSPSNSTASQCGRLLEGPPSTSAMGPETSSNPERYVLSNGYGFSHGASGNNNNTGNNNPDQLRSQSPVWYDEYTTDTEAHMTSYPADVFANNRPCVISDSSGMNGILHSVPQFSRTNSGIRYDQQATNNPVFGIRLLPNTTNMCLPATEPVV